MDEHGFELIRGEAILEISSHSKLFCHTKTQAQLLSIENNDPAKVFGVSFRTPPSDSTGIPHILEHIVLSGSQQYPVKEPFVELLKGSLAYFINALTLDDKTIYPVSSPNKQDFYNLIDVYLDAVFHPLLKPTAFKQEGWHYALSSAEEDLEFSGVVFNEMKGQISNPDTILALRTQQTLMPDSPYANHAAGDPANIPDLTYENFLAFHKVHYHPSNALFFFYGDDPVEERLRKVDSVIRSFEPAKPAAMIKPQPTFDSPRKVRLTYPASDTTENKPIAGTSWLLPVNDNPVFTLSTAILAHLLMGTPASPLRKALIDSGFGEEVYGSGYSGGIEIFEFLNQLIFTAGLKGVNPDAIGEIETLILATLSDLVKNGIEPNALEASLNSIEFQLREANTGSLPRGIMYMFIALCFWNYGRDPLALLAFTEPLKAIKNKIETNRSFFENMIQHLLLDNTHRVTLQLMPDSDFISDRIQDEQTRLNNVKNLMSSKQIDELVKTTADLNKLQQTPDRPEDLAALPLLGLNDIDLKAPTIPLDVIREDNGTILYHGLPTSGITYLDLGFNLHALEADLLPYVPLLGRALIEIGTEHEDTVQIAQRIGRETGGIESTTFSSAIRGSKNSLAFLFLRAKAMTTKTAEMLSIIHDLMLAPNLDQQMRFHQIVLEEKKRLESALIPSGHLFVNQRLRAGFDEAGWLDEQLQGADYLFFLRRLSAEVETDWSTVLQKLENILDVLCNQQICICNLTLDPTELREILPQVEEMIDGFPTSEPELHDWSWDPIKINEGLALPAQVNYVGKGASLYELGYQFDGSIHVITQYLRLTYLWEKIRVIGGAYGAFPIFDLLSGGLTFISYRDPHILETIATYEAAGDFLRDPHLDDRELSMAIIGSIGKTDPYRLPDAQGFTSMARYLTNVSDEYRQSIRDQILDTSVDDFRAFTKVLEQVAEQGRIVVMGSADKLKEANASLEGSRMEVRAVQ
jgi:Zn-dependent M16 (insulinase) family peptidase